MKPEIFFKKLTDKENHICFLHSNTKEGWGSIIAWDPIEIFSAKKLDKTFHQFIKKHQKKGNKLVGYVSYDTTYQLLNIKQSTTNTLKLPNIYFLAFKNWLEFKNNKLNIHSKDQSFKNTVQKIQKRKTCKFPKPDRKSENFKPLVKKSKYQTSYKKIKKYIKEGDIYQINLTHCLKAKSKLHPRLLFTKIIETNPVDFLAYIEGKNFEVLSASPERFVEIKNKKIQTCPVKGTRPRGKTEKQDQQLKNKLITSEKESAELNMITDLLRNDLGKVSEIGTVKVEGARLISKCPTVWHTYSKITGKIAKNLSSMQAIISMLPGGSITGCPKKRATEIIDELESTTRGIYTGVIGYIDPDDNCDFNIAIRTIIKKDQNLFLQVGGGIVLDSSENSEYSETLEKAKSFMNILC